MLFKIYYVYILKCADELYYTGVTNNMDRRLIEHNTGYNKDSFTYKRRPVELVFVHQFKYINQAIAFEKRLKKWSRKKKEAVINDRWNDLQILSKKKFQK